jgi:hypothetical protein
LETNKALEFNATIQKIKKMFFVINQGDKHWTLIAMDITTERWNVYDRLSTDVSPDGSGTYKAIVNVGYKVLKFLIQTS